MTIIFRTHTHNTVYKINDVFAVNVKIIYLNLQTWVLNQELFGYPCFFSKAEISFIIVCHGVS